MFADHPVKISAPSQPSRARGRARLGLFAFVFAALVSATTASAATAALVGQERAGTGLVVRHRPDIDGQVLTRSLAAAFAGGYFNRVPVIDGTNQDEYRLFVAIYQLDGEPTTAADYQGLVAATLNVPAAAATAIAAEYPLSAYASPSLALGEVGTDAIFACPALSADQFLSKYVPTYAYEFNDVNAPERYLPPVGFDYGAAHESEVQYLFDLQNTTNPGGLSAPQQQLAGVMKLYWTNFAKWGSPSPAPALWPPFNSANRQVLSLVEPAPQVETDFATEHNCAFWDQAG